MIGDARCLTWARLEINVSTHDEGSDLPTLPRANSVSRECLAQRLAVCQAWFGAAAQARPRPFPAEGLQALLKMAAVPLWLPWPIPGGLAGHGIHRRRRWPAAGRVGTWSPCRGLIRSAARGRCWSSPRSRDWVSERPGRAPQARIPARDSRRARRTRWSSSATTSSPLWERGIARGGRVRRGGAGQLAVDHPVAEHGQALCCWRPCPCGICATPGRNWTSRSARSRRGCPPGCPAAECPPEPRARAVRTPGDAAGPRERSHPGGGRSTVR